MRKRIRFFSLLSLSLFLIQYSSVFSDTVRLKDGRNFKNVKSRIEGKSVQVENTDGSVQTFPLESLKSIEPGEIKAPPPKRKKVKEKTPLPEKEKEKVNPGPPPLDATPKKETVEKKETNPKKDPEEKKNADPPVVSENLPTVSKQNLYWVPFPFWSALISEPRRDVGIALSFSKGLSFLLALSYARTPESATTDREKLGQLLLVREFNQTDNGNYLIAAFLRREEFKDRVYTPSGDRSITREEYSKRAETSVGLFLIFVLLDGFFTYKQYNSGMDTEPGSPALSKWNISPTVEYVGALPSSGWKAELEFRF